MAKRIRFRLRQLRRELSVEQQRDVTLKEVSEATGIAISTLSRLEAGDPKGVELATLAKLADFYRVRSASELLDIEEAETGNSLPQRLAA